MGFQSSGAPGAPTRRRVLQGAGVAVLASTCGGLVPGAAAQAAPRGPGRVVFDPRQAAGRAFGAAAAARGLATAAVADDVTDLWFHDLHTLWRDAPGPIAGLTSVSAAFCLEGLAAEFWMRPVYRGRHTVGSDGAWDHLFEGGAPPLASAVAGAGPEWAGALARIVADYRAGQAAPSEQSLTVAAGPQRGLGHDGLVSWIIAPVQRRT